MKKILALGLLALSTTGGLAQKYEDIYERTIDLNQKSLAFGLTEAAFEAIKDEAYANPNFLVGKIFQDDQLLKDNVPMRYNAYADEVEIKKNAADQNYNALIKDPDIFAKVGKETYVFIPFQGSHEKGGYFSVLADGKNYSLYKKTTALFREPRKAETSYQKDIPPSFQKTVVYYLVKNGQFLEMPNSKSRILNMMKSKKKEMDVFIKTNKIDLSKEADLVKTITYFDSLL